MKYEVNSEVVDGEIKEFNDRDEAIEFVKTLKFRGCTFDNFDVEESSDEIVVYGSFNSPSLKNWDRIVATISKYED